MAADQSFDVVIRGGTCVIAGRLERADLGIRAGKIAAMGDLANASAAEAIDAHGLTILPGVIDTQVHFREPGLEHKEDLATGTAAAALGGVTAIFEMPNTDPGTTTREALEDKVRRGREKAWVDFAFFAGATPGNAEVLAQMENMPGCCGVKIFMGSSTGTLLVDDARALRDILQHGKRRVAVHCEFEERLKERRHLVEGPGVTAHDHAVWRDEKTAFLATQTLLAAAREAGRPVHVLHVTTAQEMELLAGNKDICTVEVTPQHLTLAAPDCYDQLGTYAQMNPPIRDARHREALWAALNASVVDVIGSDHAPHTREEKDRPYPNSPSGLPGVQTMVPLMLDHVNAGKLSLHRLVELLCLGPQRLYHVADKGGLRAGRDADLTIVDMDAERTITHEAQASRCGWTPFDGRKVRGWPIMTIVRGRLVMRDGALLDTAHGEPVRFLDQ